MPASNKGKKYITHKRKMVRISLSINESVLELVDEAASKDFTSRSDIIRQSILWYLRPQGRDLAQTDPDLILKTLKQRQGRAAIRQMMKEVGPYREDS